MLQISNKRSLGHWDRVSPVSTAQHDRLSRIASQYRDSGRCDEGEFEWRDGRTKYAQRLNMVRDPNCYVCGNISVESAADLSLDALLGGESSES